MERHHLLRAGVAKDPASSAEPSADAQAEAPFVWLPAIAAHVVSFLPANDVACTLRFVDKAASEQFSDVSVRLSQPAPRWAFSEHWLAPGACKSLTLKQRRKLVCLVAASGDVANLEVAIEDVGCTLPVEVALGAAASASALECCVHLARLLEPSDGALGLPIISAAKGGHHTVCEWCLAQGAERSWGAVAAAYSGGHTELAELLRPEAEEPGRFDQFVMLEGAAEGCSLEVLKSMWAQWGEQVMEEVGAEDEFEEPFQLNMVLSAAVGSPAPDWEAKAEFLLARGLRFDQEGSADSVLSLPPDTALQRLKWMRRRGWANEEEGLEVAILDRSLPAVSWLLDAGAALEVPDCVLRYEPGEGVAPLEMAQLLVARGCIAPCNLVRGALTAGSQGLPVLRWLLDTYGAGVLDPEAAGLAPEHKWGFKTAARAGCAQAMALLTEHGVTCTRLSWLPVAQSGCEAALEWLDERGCPKPDDGRPYAAAAENGDLRTLRVLRRLGLPWGQSSGADGVFASAVLYEADLPTLRCMVAEGCPVDWAAAKGAAERRLQGQSEDPSSVEVLAWISEQAAFAQKGDQPTGS